MSARYDLPALNLEMQRRLHFTLADLDANANGLLSARQWENLIRGRGCYRAFGCAFVGMALPGSLTLLAAAAGLWLFAGGDGAWVMGGFGLLFLVASLYLAVVVMRMQHPSQMQLLYVEGPARVRFHPASDSLWDSNITIDRTTFRTTSYAARLFQQGGRFRAYYVRNGLLNTLLSVEAV
jgi:hypothetical protein